jgi:hypothetical protein
LPEAAAADGEAKLDATPRLSKQNRESMRDIMLFVLYSEVTRNASK